MNLVCLEGGIMEYQDQISALEQILYDMQTQTWLCDSRVKAKFLFDRGVRVIPPQPCGCEIYQTCEKCR